MIGRILFAVLLWFLFAEPGTAQVSEVKSEIFSGQPLIESINLFEESRYPQNWEITRDSEGNLWVGTSGNLMMFDGARWNSRSIPGLSVRSVAAGMKNRIYIGGVSEFGYLDGNETDIAGGLTYNSLTDLVPDANSDFFRVHNIIAREDSSVLFNGSYYSFHYKDSSLHSLSDDVRIFRLFEANGEVFSNDSLGLSIYKDEVLRHIPGSDQFEFTGIFCLQPIDENSILFAVRDRGLYSYDGNEFRQLNNDASDFFKQYNPYTCQRLQDGSYFFGTLEAGGIRFTADGTILGVFNEETGLPENTIYGSNLDSDGTLWLSQFEHIVKLDFGLPIRTVGRESGLNGMPLSMVQQDGNIYTGTDNGLYKSEQGDLSQFAFEKILDTQSLTKVFKAGNLVYAYTSRYLFQPEVSSLPLITFPHVIHFIYPSVSNDSVFYAVSNRGMFLVRKNQDGYEISGMVTDLNFDQAHIEQNDEGDLWIGSVQGILAHIPFSEVERFMETGQADVKEYEMPQGWRGEGSRRIIPVLDGNDVLLGTPMGLYRIDNETGEVIQDNRFGEFSRVNTLGDPNPIFAMSADDDGNIWTRSSRQFQYAKKQSDGTFEIHQKVLSRISDDQNNMIYPLNDGRVWFLGSKGMVYYDHNLAAEKQVRPPIIRSVISRSDSLLYLGYNRNKAENSQLVLPYALNDFRIEFGFPEFSSLNTTEYEVKLEGFDDDWTLWSTEAQKDYTQVREGRYRFLVRAKDITGVVSQASVLPIRILPPWYRTIWAYFLYLALISLVLYSIHKYRINKILAIQKVRNRIASDLHDEVSSTLSSITFFTEAIQKNKEKEKALRYLNLISTSAGEAKEKMSDIIWSIDPDHDNWENLITKCKRFAADMFESKNIQYDLEFPKNISGKIEIEMRQNIWLMFKEIVTNIARHSKTERAEIKVSFSGNHLHIKILDHGVGFDPENARNGNGLENIRRRAADLKGSATVKAEKDEGAEWNIHIPI